MGRIARRKGKGQAIASGKPDRRRRAGRGKAKARIVIPTPSGPARPQICKGRMAKALHDRPPEGGGAGDAVGADGGVKAARVYQSWARQTSVPLKRVRRTRVAEISVAGQAKMSRSSKMMSAEKPIRSMPVWWSRQQARAALTV